MFLCRIMVWLHSRMDGCMIEIGRWEIFFICWRFRICVLTPTPRLPLSRGIRRSTGRILVVPKTEQWLKQCLWEDTFQLFFFKCILFEILKGTCEVTAQPCGCWLWSKKGKTMEHTPCVDGTAAMGLKGSLHPYSFRWMQRVFRFQTTLWTTLILPAWCYSNVFKFCWSHYSFPFLYCQVCLLIYNSFI